jgi:DNA-binding response OmpR family regulator
MVRPWRRRPDTTETDAGGAARSGGSWSVTRDAGSGGRGDEHTRCGHRGAMKLLLVDDDAPTRRLVDEHLTRQGVDVTSVGTVAAALAAIRDGTFDVAILDVTLPDGSGMDLLLAVRQDGFLTHVIILSGATSEFDRVRALELGADDYVVKPFFVRELVARVMAVGRRQNIGHDAILEYGRMRLDLSARVVTIEGRPLGLTLKEFDLLAFLAARPRRVFSRQELLRSVWQSASAWQLPATVTEHIRRLRVKIEADPLRPRMLETVRGIGYRFVPPVADPPAADEPP